MSRMWERGYVVFIPMVKIRVKDFIWDRSFIIKLIFRCGFFVDVEMFYSV